MSPLSAPLLARADSEVPGEPIPRAALPPHEVERAIMYRLKNHPALRFTSLNVHQCGRDCVCLEGFLESNQQDIDLCEVVRGIHGINLVMNRVVTMYPPKTPPPKG